MTDDEQKQAGLERARRARDAAWAMVFDMRMAVQEFDDAMAGERLPPEMAVLGAAIDVMRAALDRAAAEYGPERGA